MVASERRRGDPAADWPVHPCNLCMVTLSPHGQHPTQGRVLSRGLQACPREGASGRRSFLAFPSVCAALHRCERSGDAFVPEAAAGQVSEQGLPHLSSRQKSALAASAGPEPEPSLVEPVCPCVPALTSPLGGSRELRGRWPRGLLEGACSRRCWVPSCPPQTGPWGGRRAAGDLELDVISGPQNRTPTQDRGRLHGADLALELTGSELLLCVNLLPSVSRLPTTLLTNRFFPGPPSAPHAQ